MSKKNHFGFKKLVPCYTDEGRCEECCGHYDVCSLPLLRVYAAAWEFAQEVLEPARERYGKPIKVLRCFQCHEMVKKMELDERYETGEVVDLSAVAGLPWRVQVVPEVTRQENLEIAKAVVEGGVWDEMVLENVDEDDLMPEYVHVTYRCSSVGLGFGRESEGENRRLVYRRRKGREEMEEVDVGRLL